MHSIADDGNVYSWGNDKDRTGLLGLGSSYLQATPILNTFFMNKKIMDISLSEKHGAAIDLNKQIFTWGTGFSGELGIDGVMFSNVPKEVVINNSALVATVKCGPTYTAMVDYNDCVLFYGKIFERRQIKTNFLNDGIRNIKENSHKSFIENSHIESNYSLNYIDNVIAKDIYCGANLIAIIDLFGNLYIYNEEEKLCKVKVTKPIQSVKFLNSNFYALTQEKDAVFEFIQKGSNFSFKNFIEKTYTVEKDFHQRISLIELPFYTNLLFFLVECSPSKKEEIERNKEKSIFTLVKNKNKEYADKFHTDDESNTSFHKDSFYITNTKTELSRMSKYSETFSKKNEYSNIQYSGYEDMSVFPPNRVKIKNKQSNRDYSYQSERSSRLSSNNTRINKISDLLGKIFNRKLSQISTLNNQSIYNNGEKKLIDIERCLNVVPFNKKHELSLRKDDKENSISKISISDNNLSVLNSPSEIINRNKFTEKKYVLSPQSSTIDDKQKKMNISNANEYKKIVKKLNFNSCIDRNVDNVDIKEKKINIIKLDLTKIKKLENRENEITRNNTPQIEISSFQQNQTESKFKPGFNSSSIKICSIADNSINLNLKENKRNLQLNKPTIDHIELSIISNRDHQTAKESQPSLSRYNSNGKSSTFKIQNLTNSCDVSHVSNGKPDVNSHTEEINEQNSEVLIKDKENESSIQNIASESFNIQIKQIFFDDSINIGPLAHNYKNPIAISENNQNSSVCQDFNKYKRNKRNHIPRPILEMKSEVTAFEGKNINNLIQVEEEKVNTIKTETNIPIPLLKFKDFHNDYCSTKTNGNHVDLVTPEKSSQPDICPDRVNQDEVLPFLTPFDIELKKKEIPSLEKQNSNDNQATIIIPRIIENEIQGVRSNGNLKQDFNGNKSIIKKLEKECLNIYDKLEEPNYLSEKQNNTLITTPTKDESFSTTENKFDYLFPGKLYKRKSSITSFRTAKKDNNTNKSISLTENKRIIVSIKDNYNSEVTSANEGKKTIIEKVENLISEKENSKILSEIPKASQQIIIKKIEEINNQNKVEKNICPFIPIKLNKNLGSNEINSLKENKIIPSNNESSEMNKSNFVKSSDCDLSIDNTIQENLKLKSHNESTISQSYSNRIESNDEVNLTKNYDQGRKKETSKINENKIKEEYQISSSFRKSGNMNQNQTMNSLIQKQKISDVFTKDKISNLKSILFKPTPSTNIVNKSLKISPVIQNNDPPKTILTNNFYQNFFSTGNLRVIDPIIEEEAYKENSFLTNYNPNNNSEDKNKREHYQDKPANGNEILIKDFVIDDAKEFKSVKENFVGETTIKSEKPIESEKNRSITNDNIESAKGKDYRKLLSPTNKIEFNTFTSIIQNSKKNSSTLASISNNSILPKSKDSTNTPNNTSSRADKSMLRENTLSKEKKSQDINSKLKSIDLRSIKNIKVSPNTSVISNFNKKRVIRDSNTNYRGSIVNKDKKRSSVNVSALIPRNINDLSNINNTSENMISLNSNNITENMILVNESNLYENDSRINITREKLLDKSNTNSILSLKIKQDVKNKASPKQIKINYLKSPDVQSDLSKTVNSFKKRNTIEKTRKSSILSKVKSSVQTTNQFEKNKRNSAFEFNTSPNIEKVADIIQLESPTCLTEKYTEGDQPSNKSSISPEKKSNRQEEGLIDNTKSTAVKSDPKSFDKFNNENIITDYERDEDIYENNLIPNKSLSLTNFKLARNENKSIVNGDVESNLNSNSNIKISNFNYKNYEDNIRYTEPSNELDNELIKKYLKDLYLGFKENEENIESNFEEYVKRIITNFEKTTSNKTNEVIRGRADSFEMENWKLMEKEKKLKSYLKKKLKDGNISPKLSFCLTPSRYLNDDDYRDKTNIFEPIELDKSQMTQRSINLSYRKSSSLPHTTNSIDFSNSSSPKKFLISSDSVSSNIQPFSMNEDRDVRYTNRIFLKRGTFSYVSNDLDILKLNSIRENAVENEYSPAKRSNESASSERIIIIENHTQ